MEGVGARLGRTSARYGPATTFTGPVRKWRKEWVPVAAAVAAWTPVNGANGGGGGDGERQAAAEETATRRRRYVPVSVVEEERQESAKSDDENKANDGDPSSNETEPSNGKTDINDTPMDEPQASDEDARDSGKNGGGTDLNLNLGLKDPDSDNEGDTAEQHEVAKNPQTENNRFKRKSVTPDLEMRM
ncbi:uncharacterized protein C2845_PM14G09400 [Panicum miliaceum]|uniref:Uncharacterized protein n=1 Tax=Panicum miliaceum TaxID=4540 RepID=A0A3L6PLB3_PANMI|nr:uncharacterized protein C2845_PM14G09400 [Panicum miliaceum]